MKKIIIVLLALGIVAFDKYQTQQNQSADITEVNHPIAAVTQNSRLQYAYANKQSDVQVEGQGRVVKVLRDDLKGSRHQKFILQVGAGHTVLVAHNIDLAPRVAGLKQGDYIEYNGEYEWSAKGGVIHWTHKDPNARHISGWLKHQGKIYQ